MEEELLAQVKEWTPRIAIPNLDLLVVNEIGKNFSGTGMDAKVINRGIEGDLNCWPGERTRISRIFVRDLSDLSYGNGVGIGMSDVIHDRILAKIDWNATWINSLTASTPGGSRTPMHFATDRECMERIAPTAGKLDPSTITIGWIQNTLELSDVLLSENLRDEIEGNSTLEIVGPPQRVDFDAAGNLDREPGARGSGRNLADGCAQDLAEVRPRAPACRKRLSSCPGWRLPTSHCRSC